MKEQFESEVASADPIESCAPHKKKTTKRDKRQTKEKTNDSVKTPRKSAVNTLTSKEPVPYTHLTLPTTPYV